MAVCYHGDRSFHRVIYKYRRVLPAWSEYNYSNNFVWRSVPSYAAMKNNLISFRRAKMAEHQTNRKRKRERIKDKHGNEQQSQG